MSLCMAVRAGQRIVVGRGDLTPRAMADDHRHQDEEGDRGTVSEYECGPKQLPADAEGLADVGPERRKLRHQFLQAVEPCGGAEH
eukprot:scaffold203_cov386-Prasinococcus_capsulatus_cf.AAC.7